MYSNHNCCSFGLLKENPEQSTMEWGKLVRFVAGAKHTMRGGPQLAFISSTNHRAAVFDSLSVVAVALDIVTGADTSKGSVLGAATIVSFRRGDPLVLSASSTSIWGADKLGRHNGHSPIV